MGRATIGCRGENLVVSGSGLGCLVLLVGACSESARSARSTIESSTIRTATSAAVAVVTASVIAADSTVAPSTFAAAKSAPLMPSVLAGWTHENDLVAESMTVVGGGPTLIAGFPESQNDCGTRQFTVRWRSVEGPVLFGVAQFTTAGLDPPTPSSSRAALDTAGLVTMSGCESPVWFGDPGQPANVLTHVVAEYQAWDAAP